jgi:hypothetical protein
VQETVTHVTVFCDAAHIDTSAQAWLRSHLNALSRRPRTAGSSLGPCPEARASTCLRIGSNSAGFKQLTSF